MKLVARLALVLILSPSLQAAMERFGAPPCPVTIEKRMPFRGHLRYSQNSEDLVFEVPAPSHDALLQSPEDIQKLLREETFNLRCRARRVKQLIAKADFELTSDREKREIFLLALASNSALEMLRHKLQPFIVPYVQPERTSCNIVSWKSS